MTDFVLDCSIAASWLFEDEASSETDDLLQSLETNRALVPGIWHLELGNVLVQSERRNRISPAQLENWLRHLRALPISTDTETPIRAFDETLALARKYSLTTYDAAYLELAIRKSIPLATLDKALLRASDKMEIDTLPIQA